MSETPNDSPSDTPSDAARDSWRPMREADLAAVEALGNRIHAALPEGAEIYAERRALFADGAWVAEHRGRLAGYALFHPWRSATPPPLDTLLGRLPEDADVLYLHDVAVDPLRRSLGLAGAMIASLPARARALGLPAIELVAVLGTANFWRGHGFAALDQAAAGPALAQGLAKALAKYGDGALLMRREV